MINRRIKKFSHVNERNWFCFFLYICFYNNCGTFKICIVRQENSVQILPLCQLSPDRQIILRITKDYVSNQSLSEKSVYTENKVVSKHNLSSRKLNINDRMIERFSRALQCRPNSALFLFLLIGQSICKFIIGSAIGLSSYRFFELRINETMYAGYYSEHQRTRLPKPYIIIILCLRNSLTL